MLKSDEARFLEKYLLIVSLIVSKIEVFAHFLKITSLDFAGEGGIIILLEMSTERLQHRTFHVQLPSTHHYESTTPHTG